MVYAYDKWMQLPVRDLYDTQMMLAAVSAAKDMYEKGLLQIKDFKKEYGDFYSPILSDMDWYKANVTDPVVNTINDLYAKGIDPIRSVEGRAAVSKLINGIDPSAINFLKLRAQNATAMLKSIDELKAKGLYNEAYSKSRNEDPNLWKSNFAGMSSASPYLDYHQKYNHLFKDMDYEYDEEESKKHPGMIAMTRSKSRMHDILNSVRKDLENDPQYQYDLNNLASLVQSLNPDISSEGALSTARRMLEDEIVERNYKGGMKLEIDPVWKDQQDFKQQVALENLRHSHNKKLLSNSKDEPADKEYGSYDLSLLARGLLKWAGSADPGLQGLQLAESFGNSTKSMMPQTRKDAFLNFYSMMGAEDTGSWVLRFSKDPSRTKDAAAGGVIYIPTADRSKLYTLGELVSNTLGSPDQQYREKNPIEVGSGKKKSDSPLSMVPTGLVYTAPMKNGSYEQFVEVRIGNEDGQKTYYYKKYQSEPAPITSPEIDYSRGLWMENQYKNIGILPQAGFNILPSNATVNPWAIQDRSLNSAVGYGSEPLHSGTTLIITDILLNQ